MLNTIINVLSAIFIIWWFFCYCYTAWKYDTLRNGVLKAAKKVRSKSIVAGLEGTESYVAMIQFIDELTEDLYQKDKDEIRAIFK
jgi:hypothetical protein